MRRRNRRLLRLFLLHNRSYHLSLNPAGQILCLECSRQIPRNRGRSLGPCQDIPSTFYNQANDKCLPFSQGFIKQVLNVSSNAWSMACTWSCCDLDYSDLREISEENRSQSQDTKLSSYQVCMGWLHESFEWLHLPSAAIHLQSIVLLLSIPQCMQAVASYRQPQARRAWGISL